jgi:hypothetical protein
MLSNLGMALGFVVLTFLTSTITFVVIVFGIMLRRKILLWDDHWKEKVEATGITMAEFADDLERTHQKVRATFRLLAFFLFVVVILMGVVAYLGIQEKPILGYPYVTKSLWLLALMALSALLPAFISFAVGTYLTETMMLKAGAFAFKDAREEMREKKMKMKMMEKAKELKSKWASKGLGVPTASEANKPETPETTKPGAPEASKPAGAKR